MRAGSLAGVVLCGGESRRMGRDKALLPVDGVPMAVRVARALAEAGADPVLAQGGDLEGLRAAGLATVPDDDPGGGPLPATIQALRASEAAIVLVVGCDLVRPSSAALRATVDALLAAPHADVAVPLLDGHRQWVHAAWRSTAAAGLAAAQAAGARSLRKAARTLSVVEVAGLDPKVLADADGPADLDG